MAASACLAERLQVPHLDCSHQPGLAGSLRGARGMAMSGDECMGHHHLRPARHLLGPAPLAHRTHPPGPTLRRRAAQCMSMAWPATRALHLRPARHLLGPPPPAHRSPSRRNRSSPRRPRSVALPLAPCCCLEQPTRSTSSTRRSTGSLATVRRRCRRTACRPLPTPGPPMRATGLRRARRPRMASCLAGGAACRRVRAGELCFTERLQCVFSAIQCRRT